MVDVGVIWLFGRHSCGKSTVSTVRTNISQCKLDEYDVKTQTAVQNVSVHWPTHQPKQARETTNFNIRGTGERRKRHIHTAWKWVASMETPVEFRTVKKGYERYVSNDEKRLCRVDRIISVLRWGVKDHYHR